jgi:hypothetical protein
MKLICAVDSPLLDPLVQDELLARIPCELNEPPQVVSVGFASPD